MVTAVLLLAPLHSTAQSAGIVGIEHTGINVPDMAKAVQFFTNVLGFTPVTELGPFPFDAAWKQTFQMQSGTGPVTIKMVRAGTGANIELFYYQDNKGSSKQPGADDIGATHIAFYTDDLPASVAYLRSKGVKVLGEPVVVSSGDTAGESWVYFETPWGSRMELVSYPQGLGYEKTNPKAKLWSPKNPVAMPAESKRTALTKAEADLLINRHLQFWNQRDGAKRDKVYGEVYAENLAFVDHHFVANGRAEVTAFVNDLQKKNPSWSFRPAKPIVYHHNMVRLYWQFGPASKPDTVTGMDFFVVENGKVQTIYVILDNPPKP